LEYDNREKLNEGGSSLTFPPHIRSDRLPHSSVTFGWSWREDGHGEIIGMWRPLPPTAMLQVAAASTPNPNLPKASVSVP
jgi:hypothetical protein